VQIKSTEYCASYFQLGHLLLWPNIPEEYQNSPAIAQIKRPVTLQP
jgi:hypothetical protein